MITAIIQARLGSSRLPGKTLMDIAGRPMLGRLIDRVWRIPGLERIVIATTMRPNDRAIVDFAGAEGLPVYKGSEDDVLDRFYQAAQLFEASLIVRVTPDCPFLDPEVSGRVLTRFGQDDVDYASNIKPPSFPDGLDTEVFSFAALARAWRETKLPSEREHVTPYLWKNPDKFRLANVTNDHDLSGLRWTVDEAPDLTFARAVYAALGPEFGMNEVLAWLAERPDISQLNAGLPRNEGYLKSLQQDQVS